MRRPNLRDILLIGTVAVILGIGGLSYYKQKTHEARIDAIRTGEIRGDKNSFVFHVPTCSEYNSIKPENIRTFATVKDATDAGYRASRNCADAAETRNINETEINEGPELDHDDQRY